MKPLYDIQAEHQAILDEFETLFMVGEPTEEDIAALNEKLAINAEEFEQKAEAYAAVITQKRARAKFLRDEIKKLKAMAESEDSQADRLENRIAWAMQEQNLDKVELPHFKLRFHKSEAVEITDVLSLPLEFIKSKVEEVPDKDAIKKAIKAGQCVPGAVIKENRSLLVK